MLTRTDDGSPFCTGRARFLDAQPGRPARTSSVYVRVLPEGAQFEVVALLDTGARWSILEEPVARELGLLNAERERHEETLNTRFGNITGFVTRVPMTLVAEEGPSLEVEATVFVSADWPAGTFLGYQGCLERVNFAVDSASQTFFFGPWG
jgi:hypothetical protein